MCDEIKFVHMSSKEAISERRLALFKEIDGDMFFSLSLWPNEMKMVFWKKPIGDKDAFGNGCPPDLIKNWIVSSTFWEQNKVRSDGNQLTGNISKNERKWFYFDLHLNKYVFMDCSD